MILLAYIADGLVTLLPQRWRRSYASDTDLCAAAGTCGVLQYGLCAVLFLTRFIAFLQASMAGIGAAAVARNQEEVLSAVQYHVGIVYSTQFVLSPFPVLLVYLMCEGLARFLAAAVTREVLGTAPFYLLARVWEILHKLIHLPGEPSRAIGPAEAPGGFRMNPRCRAQRLSAVR